VKVWRHSRRFGRRSLVERAETPGAAVAFTLQSVVLEYVTESLVEDVANEITACQPRLLVEQPLIKAQAKDYLRHTQERLIGESILRRLGEAHAAEPQLLACWQPGEVGRGRNRAMGQATWSICCGCCVVICAGSICRAWSFVRFTSHNWMRTMPAWSTRI
jgi:hypothetical protein